MDLSSMKDPSIPVSHCPAGKPGGNGNLTCPGTWLVPCQVSHFFGLDFFKVSPAKMRYLRKLFKN
jgi:hypothetical protein